MISERAKALLEFEAAHPCLDSAKLQMLRKLGLTPAGYAARLEHLLADVDVMAEYPELVYRYWNQRRERFSAR